jgi:putative ABC transport system ATP-binding protein
MTKIALVNVSKIYTIKHKPVISLDDVSFIVEKGTFLVLSGPSGSGKSTILQLISGIEPPSTGHIIIDDQDITKLSAQQLAAYRRQKIGIVFQQFYLEPTLTLRQNIELPAMFSSISNSARRQRTVELAEYIGLSEHLDHLPSQLSGGQIQRAAVARAIYSKPTILIADEPTSNLDQENLENVISLFKQIQQTYGTTIIIATHDQSVAQYASRTIKLKEGRIIQSTDQNAELKHKGST